MTAAPLTSPTSASAEPPFLPPAGDFCQQRQKSPKTPLETAFQDFLTRVGYDFALTCPTRNRFSGFFRFKGLCLHSFPRCAVARRCPLPRWVPWCSTARVPADIPSRRTTLSAPHDRCAPDGPPRPQARNPLFLPPAGDFCQQRQKSPKTPLETAFQDFLTRVGYDFALTCPTRNRFSGFFRFKGLCLHSFPRCAVARRCPLPRWVPWCSTARVPADIPSRRTTLSAPHDRRAP